MLQESATCSPKQAQKCTRKVAQLGTRKISLTRVRCTWCMLYRRQKSKAAAFSRVSALVVWHKSRLFPANKSSKREKSRHAKLGGRAAGGARCTRDLQTRSAGPGKCHIPNATPHNRNTAVAANNNLIPTFPQFRLTLLSSDNYYLY